MCRKPLALFALFLLVALPTAGQRSDSFFSMTTTKTFLPGEKISVRLYSHGVRALEFRVYRVNDPLHFFERLGDVHNFNTSGLGWRDPVVEAPDLTVGHRLGAEIADFVLDNFLTPVHDRDDSDELK